MSNLSRDKKIDAMYEALVGNEELGVDGLVSQVKGNAKEIKSVKVGLARAKWVLTGVGLGSGVFGSKIIAFISKILNFL